MKRRFCTGLLILMCVFLTACGGGKSAPADLKEVLSKFSFEGDMMELNEADMLDFYGIDAADMKQFAAAVNTSGIDCDEAVLVEAVDKDAASRVKDALERRYQSKLNEMDGYLPDEYAIIKACSVRQTGLSVAMIVSENADEMVKLYQDSFR